MGFRIVLIGGGSCMWTPILAQDLFLRPNLKGSELVLVDIDPKAVRLLETYCKILAEKVGTGWKVSVAGHAKALDGADFVCASISTGGFDAMHHDYTIPEKFGVYHTVGDTVGPAGISRSLRNIPVFVGFAQMMEKYCPDAWLVHVTNPLSQLTRAVCKTSSIKCVGLCHNWICTLKFLGRYFGVDYRDVEAVSVGVNHGSWMKDITVKGKPVEHKLSLERYLKFEAGKKAPAKTGTVDDLVNAMLKKSKSMEEYISFELFRQFGYFPVGEAPHVVENYPHFCNSPRTLKQHLVRRKGVLPGRTNWKEARRKEVVEMVKGTRPLPELEVSSEGLSAIADGVLTGNICREIVNMPNEGQITNLPHDVIVETLGVASYGKVTPILAGPIPAPLLGWMQTIVEEQELTVEAALTGDREKVIQALVVSPQLANKDCAPELADRLLQANRAFLPQFFKKNSAGRKSNIKN
ncbi:MAG: hypothetical protein WC869_13680 [Phycisphaerae bacterium]